MKIHFLRFDADDLSLDNGLWVTSAVNIYNNSNFVNYSTYQTGYGLGGELFTWAGLKRTSGIGTDDLEYFTLADLQNQDSWTDFDTDMGVVRNGRIIDTSARVDITDFTVNSKYDSADMYIYGSETNDETYYTQEWFEYGGVGTSEELDAEDVQQYLKFAFDLPEDPTVESDIEILVRVEIHDPAISVLHQFTRSFVRNFPQWMDMHDTPPEGATPAVTEPDTVGAQFINAIVGEGLDSTYRDIYYNRNQLRIDTVDLDQLSSAYTISGIPDRIYSVTAGDATPSFQPAIASSYEEFLRSDPMDHVVYIDYDEGVLYSIQNYSKITLNSDEATPSRYDVYNFLDDLGEKVDLYRIDGESNENFQKRILDVYKNKPGAGLESLKLSLRRELDLWRTEGATPDSNYVGATPNILHMEDILEDPEFFTARGLPTSKFMGFIDQLSRLYPSTWGRFIWGQGIWDIAGEEGVGYDVIPYQYDATPVARRFKKPGVGDGEDLLVYRPDANTGPEDYTATLRVRGLEKTEAYEYTGINLDFYTQPVGTYDAYDNPTTTVKLTVEASTNDATPIVYYAIVEMSATSDVDATTPATTDQSWAFDQIFSDVEDLTAADLVFRAKSDDTVYGTDFATPLDPGGTIPISSIGSVSVVQGAWSVSTQNYTEVEGNDYYKVWLSHDPGTTLEISATPNALTVNNSTINTDRPELVLESKQVASPVPTEWRGDRVEYNITLNGVAPYTSAVPQDVTLNGIFFDSYVTSPSIELGLTTQEDPAAATPLLSYGGITENDRGEEIFIDGSLIFVESASAATPSPSAAWNANGVQSLPDTTTAVTFTTGEEATPTTYPVLNYTWESFEALQSVPFSGIADIHGPWIDGKAPKEGNTNLNAHVYDSLERSDFGVPDTADYILQRIEALSDNDRVVTTLSTNVIASAIQDDEVTSNPPDNAIAEKYDDNAGVYYFEPFYLQARAKRGPTKEWNPQIHTGFVYTRDNEYYVFSKPETLTSATTEIELNEIARQGAPIIVEDGNTALRQVSFYDEETLALTFTNTETIEGDGTDVLFAAYADIYDISVNDMDGNPVSVLSTSASDNSVKLSSLSNPGEEYEVSYKLKNSFYIDHEHLDANNVPKSKIYFDQLPDVEYSVTYETSDLKETSFADIALNPAYSTQTEGFIFISDNEYEYKGIDFYMNPSAIPADGQSFSMLTFYAFDRDGDVVLGNPKANLDINVTTTFGTFNEATPSQSTTVTTDIDGFAHAILYSEAPATPGDPIAQTAQITFTPVP